MVDVEIDDGDARRTVRRLAWRAAMAALANRQKPIGRAGSQWWPGGRVAQKARRNSPFITASTAAMPRPGGAQRGLGAAPGHDGVAIERDRLVRFRADRQDRRDVVFRMHARRLLDGRERRLVADQVDEFPGIQRLQHRTQPVGAFGVVRAGIVMQAGAMGQQQDAHVGGSSRLRMTKR